jgi:hypothetical protein
MVYDGGVSGVVIRMQQTNKAAAFEGLVFAFLETSARKKKISSARKGKSSCYKRKLVKKEFFVWYCQKLSILRHVTSTIVPQFPGQFALVCWNGPAGAFFLSLHTLHASLFPSLLTQFSAIT